MTKYQGGFSYNLYNNTIIFYWKCEKDIKPTLLLDKLFAIFSTECKFIMDMKLNPYRNPCKNCTKSLSRFNLYLWNTDKLLAISSMQRFAFYLCTSTQAEQ